MIPAIHIYIYTYVCVWLSQENQSYTNLSPHPDSMQDLPAYKFCCFLPLVLPFLKQKLRSSNNYLLVSWNFWLGTTLFSRTVPSLNVAFRHQANLTTTYGDRNLTALQFQERDASKAACVCGKQRWVAGVSPACQIFC